MLLAGLFLCPRGHDARVEAASPRDAERVRTTTPTRHSLQDLIDRRSLRAVAPVPPALRAPHAVEDGTWSPMFLNGRSGHSAIYDPVRDRMIVFGGDDGWTFSRDVWELSFSGTPAWTNITPEGLAPSGRTVHVAVYDPVRDRMIVFGGWDANARQDVWTLALAGDPVWTELTPAGTPPPVGFSDAAVYDPVRDRLIVFDGTGGGWTDAVWALELSGTPEWTQLSPLGTPPGARTGMSAVYDPVRDRVLIFGGDDGGYPNRNDTWELSLAGTPTWTELSPTGSLPSGRAAHAAVYDADDDCMVICGGTDQYAFENDAWLLSLSGPLTWAPIASSGDPPGRALFSSIFDSQRDRIVIFGGVDDVYYPDLNDSWALSLSGSPVWTPVPGAFPGVRAGHTMVRDSVRDRAIIFGGYTWPPKYYEDAWVLPLGGNTPWEKLAPSGPVPSGRSGHSAIYDSLRDRMVIFGGDGWSGLDNDVWALSLAGNSSWSELTPSGDVPAPRSGHTAIYDVRRDRMVVFGGEKDNDVWTLNFGIGTYWTRTTPSGAPPSARKEHSAIYDEDRDRMIIFGGDGNNDVWELSLEGQMTWTELLPSGTPPEGRSRQSAVYDSVRDRMVVFGGYGFSNYNESNEAWALSLDAAPAWTKLAPIQWAPEARKDHAAVYDPVRDCMTVFGGSDFYVDYNDTWILSWGEPTATSHTPEFSNTFGPCYPNPFNPRITISFELQVDGRATLAIYDVAGHRVRTLLDEWTARGIHDTSWDGNSDTGAHLGSGVYFCHLAAPGFSATRKLVLLK